MTEYFAGDDICSGLEPDFFERGRADSECRSSRNGLSEDSMSGQTQFAGEKVWRDANWRIARER